MYAGALKKFADAFSTDIFFQTHSVFNALDYKRMGDLRYCLNIICTMLTGYFNRDDVFEQLLERYNDDFPMESEYNFRLQNVLAYIEECGFEAKSRVWRKADLFTLIVELDISLHAKDLKLQPGKILESLSDFYEGIDTKLYESSFAHAVYYKAALQATNDKINRIRRGFIIGALLEDKSLEQIENELKENGLG